MEIVKAMLNIIGFTKSKDDLTTKPDSNHMKTGKDIMKIKTDINNLLRLIFFYFSKL